MDNGKIKIVFVTDRFFLHRIMQALFELNRSLKQLRTQINLMLKFFLLKKATIKRLMLPV